MPELDGGNPEPHEPRRPRPETVRPERPPPRSSARELGDRRRPERQRQPGGRERPDLRRTIDRPDLEERSPRAPPRARVRSRPASGPSTRNGRGVRRGPPRRSANARRTRGPDPTRGPDRTARAPPPPGAAGRSRTPRRTPRRASRGQVREEPGPEAEPVQERRDVRREERAPPVRHLPPQLRHRHGRPQLARDVQRGRRHDERGARNPPRRAEQRARPRQERPDDRGGHGGTDRVQGERDPPSAPASPVDHGGDGLHHRQASGAEQARDPRDDRRDDERETDRLAQHRTLSSRYVMQKTLRPRGQ